MAVKRNFWLLLILINFSCASQNSLNSHTKAEIHKRLDRMLDSIDSTLELQNTAINLLQNKLYQHHKTHTVELCFMSAALASVVTLLMIYSTHKTSFPNRMDSTTLTMCGFL